MVYVSAKHQDSRESHNIWGQAVKYNSFFLYKQFMYKSPHLNYKNRPIQHHLEIGIVKTR